jgi:hypothetical protein
MVCGSKSFVIPWSDGFDRKCLKTSWDGSNPVITTRSVGGPPSVMAEPGTGPLRRQREKGKLSHGLNLERVVVGILDVAYEIRRLSGRESSRWRCTTGPVSTPGSITLFTSPGFPKCREPSIVVCCLKKRGRSDSGKVGYCFGMGQPVRIAPEGLVLAIDILSLSLRRAQPGGTHP